MELAFLDWLVLVIEAKYDDKNEIMNWPISVSPYDCASYSSY